MTEDPKKYVNSMDYTKGVADVIIRATAGVYTCSNTLVHV